MTGRHTALRSIALFALALGMFAVIGASECAKVDSSVTGPEEESAFLPACWIAAMDAREEEMHRFRAALEACSGDRECILAEKELNETNLRAIKAEFFECRESCHEQGGGTGGQ
jgi:hypothetical protein